MKMEFSKIILYLRNTKIITSLVKVEHKVIALIIITMIFKFVFFANHGFRMSVIFSKNYNNSLNYGTFTSTS